ncbi:hypothetical protein HYPSUDRAFT_205330 [Hypholoma sublateritium FD-334 SS-4]|uniref:Uncharacterized protein n=1 Tax=Hypholoma sublateritium (strain FD-334 SS-4) TaxID=945553 RepID=A0A0D2NHS4_HYPSF|nr:hypothetical protein HYPSUDRAFT_205330 [Hypholoma sublateritium FD-334 SS-4]
MRIDEPVLTPSTKFDEANIPALSAAFPRSPTHIARRRSTHFSHFLLHFTASTHSSTSFTGARTRGNASSTVSAPRRPSHRGSRAPIDALTIDVVRAPAVRAGGVFPECYSGYIQSDRLCRQRGLVNSAPVLPSLRARLTPHPHAKNQCAHCVLRVPLWYPNKYDAASFNRSSASHRPPTSHL